MNERNLNILSDEIIKVLIGSAVTLICTIIPYVAVDKKTKIEHKNKREIAELKLNRIYIKLLLMFINKPKYKLFSEKSDVQYVIDNAHYLDKNARILVMKLIEMESGEINDDEGKIIHTKYMEALEKLIIEEHRYLSDLLFGDFEKYMSKIKTSKAITFLSKFDSIAMNVFLITLVIAIFIFLVFRFSKFAVSGYNSYIVGSIVLIATFWITIAMIGAGNLFTRFLLDLWKKMNLSKRTYSIGDTVPKSGVYKCKICNQEELFSESLIFESCKNDKNHKFKLASLSLYIWKAQN